MLSQIEHNLTDSIRARHDQLLSDLERYVAIPTGYNHTHGLDEFRGLVVDRLEALGAHTHSVPGDPRPSWISGKGNNEDIPPTVVCRRSVDGQPSVLIAGHLDTVFDPAGDFQTLEVSGDGTSAIGPGVVDMKGGILIAVAALEALAEAGIKTSWSFILNSDEEVGSFFSDNALLAEAREHDLGLALEPALPSGALAIERRGSGQFKIEAFGVSAHAGREFHKGESAVYALARTLGGVEKLINIDGGVTLNIGPVSGGIATNVVPDHAAAWGNIRYPDQESADDTGRKLDALATPEGVVPRVVMHRAFNRPAKPCTPAVEKLALAARTCAEALGQTLPFESTGGVCDGNILQAAGLPTIDTLGVRGGGLHTTEEWIELSSLVERAQLFALLLSRVSEGSVEWRTT